MLKIAEMLQNGTPNSEFIVLQNQGRSPVQLRGHMVCTEAIFSEDPSELLDGIYLFRHDIVVQPQMRVVLFTVSGECRYQATSDGPDAWVEYMGRNRCAWSHAAQVTLLEPVCTRRSQCAVATAVG